MAIYSVQLSETKQCNISIYSLLELNKPFFENKPENIFFSYTYYLIDLRDHKSMCLHLTSEFKRESRESYKGEKKDF